MRQHLKFYIDGHWVDPIGSATMNVINPATEAVCGQIAVGDALDVDKAVEAAVKALPYWSLSDREERLAVLRRILAEYKRRAADLAVAVTEEMGAPATFAERAQVPAGLAHIAAAIKILENFAFEEDRGATAIIKEAVGVCALITPWNWPLNQITCKIAPAIATGCTMILKPSEVSPFSAQIFAEIMDAAEVPAGVFNMVYGDGPGVGVPLSTHPAIDMVSFTGSTRAGIEVSKNAAPTVKRVHLELGGKSPNIILDDASFAKAVGRSVQQIMSNSGQSCNAPTRLLVPSARMGEAIEAARARLGSITVGDPTGNVQLGPVVSDVQWTKIQGLIQTGIDEGAELIGGGTGRPEGLEQGYFVKPTVFANVTNDMTIAREEIFGPVLVIIGYDEIDDAVAIANDTSYGLAAYVSGEDVASARSVALRLRAGQVSINGAADMAAPFGGYKMSGNGREWGAYGFEEFLEVKAVLGGNLVAVE